MPGRRSKACPSSRVELSGGLARNALREHSFFSSIQFLFSNGPWLLSQFAFTPTYSGEICGDERNIARRSCPSNHAALGRDLSRVSAFPWSMWCVPPRFVSCNGFDCRPQDNRTVCAGACGLQRGLTSGIFLTGVGQNEKKRDSPSYPKLTKRSFYNSIPRSCNTVPLHRSTITATGNFSAPGRGILTHHASFSSMRLGGLLSFMRHCTTFDTTEFAVRHDLCGCSQNLQQYPKLCA